MTWITYTDEADAVVAAAILWRAYIRQQADAHTDGMVLHSGLLTPHASLSDEELHPLETQLPGRKKGQLVLTAGATTDWAEPRETDEATWALPIPVGIDHTTLALPAGYTDLEGAPVWPADEEMS